MYIIHSLLLYNTILTCSQKLTLASLFYHCYIVEKTRNSAVANRSAYAANASSNSVTLKSSYLRRIPIVDSRLPSVLLTNVCHLGNKLGDLSVTAQQYKPNVICITETWLNENIPDANVNLLGYNLFRKDGVNGSGGGVCLSVCSVP